MTSGAITTGPIHAQPQYDPTLGAVFTRPWVVELILDLAGYAPELDLAGSSVVEPAVGHGAFVVPLALRLLQSSRLHGVDINTADSAILSFDIDAHAVEVSRRAVRFALENEGLRVSKADDLARSWVRQADFLEIAKELAPVDWVIGNPPYVRLEDSDKRLMSAYRQSWPTMTGRADVYVGFIEAGLSILRPDGRLAVICADRWMRNQYGAALRRKIESSYSVDASIAMHEVQAFEDTVDAYPAITLIRNGDQGPALICTATEDFDAKSTGTLLSAWRRGPAPVEPQGTYKMSWSTGWFKGGQSWPDADPARLDLLKELEERHPLLEETNCTVSVGVATGADKIYMTAAPGSIERDRLLKTVSARETSSGKIAWAGRYLVNPWLDDQLMALEERPHLSAYLRQHETELRRRHVAKKNPEKWWRTIDRVAAEVAQKPKLLIPDLKDRIAPVLDVGEYYPSHSLYYITTESWDLEVLGGLLLSDLATLFVECYSVRMASGYMRVSAQYLRRVRVPSPDTISDTTAQGLRQAFRHRDVSAASAHARVAYGVT